MDYSREMGETLRLLIYHFILSIITSGSSSSCSKRQSFSLEKEKNKKKQKTPKPPPVYFCCWVYLEMEMSSFAFLFGLKFSVKKKMLKIITIRIFLKYFVTLI